MQRRPVKSACKLLIVLAIFSIQARAQLSTYVSDRGNLVFTNADLPAPKASAPAAPETAKPVSPASAPAVAAAPAAAEPRVATTPALHASPVFPAASPLTGARPAVSPALDRISSPGSGEASCGPKAGQRGHCNGIELELFGGVQQGSLGTDATGSYNGETNGGWQRL